MCGFDQSRNSSVHYGAQARSNAESTWWCLACGIRNHHSCCFPARAWEKHQHGAEGRGRQVVRQLSKCVSSLSSFSNFNFFQSIAHLLLDLWGTTRCPATSLSSSLQPLWSRLMKCYKARDAGIFSEAAGMGSQRQSRQAIVVTWEHSPPPPQVSRALLPPSTVVVHSPISACGGWLFLTFGSIIKAKNK